MRFQYLLSLTVAPFFLVACKNSSRDIYMQEAKDFCAVFSPAVWEDMRKESQGAKLQDEFLRRVDEAVKSKEFEGILDAQHSQPKDAEILYRFYVDSITKLTGTEFVCPDLKVYFSESLPKS